MKSYSQVGQDEFAVMVMSYGSHTFLDIGCNHPIERSNTYALEQIGWTGILVDNDQNCVELCRQQRKSPVIQADVTQPGDWIPGEVDYLSLDVDACTLDALRVLAPRLRFKVATIEHDSYRFGYGPRDEMRKILFEAGYHLFRPDVSDMGMEFEDWWIGPSGSPSST